MAAAGGKATSAPIMGRDSEPTIFELSSPGRRAASFRTTGVPEWRGDELVPSEHLRDEPAPIAEISERSQPASLGCLVFRSTLISGLPSVLIGFIAPRTTMG